MAHSTNRATYGQFSVIARLREGSVSSLSTYGIILEIQNHLKRYKCVCNVAFSPPNFIIHLPTVQLQLQIISSKAIAGPDYVLDLVPWCSEYTSFDLPWVIRCLNPNAPDRIEPISLGISRSRTDSLGPSRTPAGPSFLQASSGSSRAPKRCRIGSSSSPQLITNKRKGLIHKGIQIKLDSTLDAQNHQMTVDFSYLMITELKNFYFQKFRAFQNCNDICREMYGLAQAFSNNVEPAVTSIYEQKPTNEKDQDIFDHVIRDAGDLHNSLWFMSEEMFGLHITMGSISDNIIHPIRLDAFLENQSDGQATQPIIAANFLKATAEFTVSQIHGRHLMIATEEDLTGAFCTQIWCVYFHHEYKALIGVPKEEAEANAIYRFLKHLTNVLGYSIEDKNSQILYTMVSQINHLNVSISDFQLCVDEITGMVDHVSKNISNILASATSHIPAGKAPHVTTQIDSLLALLQQYNNMIRNASESFHHHKEIFRSIKFRSAYPSMSD